jgi:SIR2-like domain
MTEDDWKVLLGRIKEGKCTPFLGAGVNYGILPLGGQIAHEWASEDKFPLRSSDDLPAVAQFIAVKYSDAMYPKDKILARLSGEKKPDFSQPDPRLDCLRALAELPLPVYLTTNYDDLLLQALRHTDPPKSPRREICRWHAGLKSIPVVLGATAKYAPDYAHPVVFHFHGSDEHCQSLVLTEDDYLDFLVNISRNQKILPARIQEALTDASLLFIGYRLRDINFRVIYRGLVQSMEGSLRRLNVTVQISPPDDHSGDTRGAEEYLAEYFKDLKVRVFWGTGVEFARELRGRWRTFCGADTSTA